MKKYNHVDFEGENLVTTKKTQFPPSIQGTTVLRECILRRSQAFNREFAFQILNFNKKNPFYEKSH